MAKGSTSGSDRPSLFESDSGVKSWNAGAARRAKVMGPATDCLLELAGIARGMRVLDLAAGTGEQSLLAAQRVGTDGMVLATDLSASMLESAAKAARALGLSNVETRVMDTQAIDLPASSFDAAISRLGLMFLKDLSDALQGIYRVLRPEGKFSALVMGDLAHNPMLKLAREVAQKYVDFLPDVLTEEQLHGLGENDTLGAALRLAGFRDVNSKPVRLAYRYDDAAEAAASIFDSNPFFARARSELDEEDRSVLLRDLEKSLRPFEDAGQCVLPGEVLVVAGTRCFRA